MLKVANRLSGFFVLFVLVALFAGCASMQQAKITVQMQDRTNAYRKAIRWSEYDIAAPYIRRRDGSTFSFDTEFYEQIRVVENEIQNREVFEADGLAIVTSKIRFYHVDYNSVVDLTDRQTWWYDAETEQWFLDGSFPDYATALEN